VTSEARLELHAWVSSTLLLRGSSFHVFCRCRPCSLSKADIAVQSPTLVLSYSCFSNGKIRAMNINISGLINCAVIIFYIFKFEGG